MSEKFTNKQKARILELERLSWNAALEAAKLEIMKGPHYKDCLSACDRLWKTKGTNQ